MLVALYRSEHGLPYRAASRQPVEIFLETERFAERILSPLTYPPVEFPLGKSTLWPMLLALHRMDLPYMANVFAMYPSIKKEGDPWRVPDHIPVNITTVPDRGDDDGMPLVVHGDATCVRLLWSLPDRRSKALFRAGPKPLSASDDIDGLISSWTEYFDRELRDAKQDALNCLREAEKVAEPFMDIPDVPLRAAR